ncbi:MAG: 4Fe-4S dicluster domain-containing protein [Acholeplasmataceae bacterium]|nr:MAG: 4Fe-4S dicluster domain-containing protein [Acholeplasmataceae bacterium]
MPKNVNITINGRPLVVPASHTVLKAAEAHDIFIPRLCYLEGVHEEGNCRLCSVEINGQDMLKPACRTLVEEGMTVTTENPKIYEYVSINLELLAANHHFECFKCSREENCELLSLLRTYSVGNEFSDLYGFELKETHLNLSSDAMVVDTSKCVLCGRCVSTCQQLTGLGILDFNQRGAVTYVGPAQFHNLEDSGCIYCGKCIQACPTGALRENDDIRRLEKALRQTNKTVIMQVAPSVRAALGEAFGYPIGTNVEGKLFAALYALGVNEIIDTNFTADLTIVEEATEFIDRLRNGGTLPMFTSCSPGWINYLEQYFSDYIPHLSTCKSPQQMAGALIKTYYAKKLDLDPRDIVSVAIMPCVAKKAEANRPGMGRDGYKDVDIVLTTRELGRLIRRRGIDFKNLSPMEPFGDLARYTGAAAIFGASGGVMEAALRTVSDMLDGNHLKGEFVDVRGKDGIKEATYQIAGMDVNVAVVQGGKAIHDFLTALPTQDKTYHFVEFMGCIGGCINGGGQPIVQARDIPKQDIIKLRSKVLYDIDKHAVTRKSHMNPAVRRLYEEYLNPLGAHDVHELLHTHYEAREPYSK